jgi:hypothetical protein
VAGRSCQQSSINCGELRLHDLAAPALAEEATAILAPFTFLSLWGDEVIVKDIGEEVTVVFVVGTTEFGTEPE